MTMDIQNVNVSESIAKVLSVLSETRKGGFAVIKGYVSSSNRVEPETSDITFNSRFSYENLIMKKMDMLSSIRFEDLELKGEKLLKLSIEDQKKQFIDSKSKMMTSIETTLTGVREDAHRIAHDTFYCQVDNGVKVHLKTEKVNGETRLILENGRPTAESIMISALEVGRKVKVPGVYKVVNSGAKVLMDKAIEKVLKTKGFKDIKTFSLKEGNFESLHIDGSVIV